MTAADMAARAPEADDVSASPHFYKAQPAIALMPVDSIALVFDREIPERRTLEEAAQTYLDEGTRLERYLFLTIPGGTYDALLRRMLERRATLLRIPFYAPHQDTSPLPFAAREESAI